jgi:hypothetical protein
VTTNWYSEVVVLLVILVSFIKAFQL